MRAWVACLLSMAVAAVLAGCADGGSRPSGPVPCGTACVFTSDDLPGVELSLVHTASGRDHGLEATVHNKGPMIYWHLWVPACNLDPWADRMEGPQGPVIPREPGVYCHPCGADPLGVDETMRKSFQWDERLWDIDEERASDAPAGTYRWSVEFRAERDQASVCGGDRLVHGEVALDVQ